MLTKRHRPSIIWFVRFKVRSFANVRYRLNPYSNHTSLLQTRKLSRNGRLCQPSTMYLIFFSISPIGGISSPKPPDILSLLAQRKYAKPWRSQVRLRRKKAFSECPTATGNATACSQCFWITMNGLIASSVGRLPLRRGCLTMSERRANYCNIAGGLRLKHINRLSAVH